jgi:hypothetical protein
MTERRYNEDEVAEIFARAARADTENAVRAPLARSEGMTLSELEAIGREAGLAPDRVAEAARSLTRVDTQASRQLLGITIGVGRIVELDRRLSDEEWERLVVRLRETFDARGTLRAHGSLREWTNGNLQALLEPTPTGSRLRLRTLHGSARGLIAGGAAMIALTGVIAAITAATVGTTNPEAFTGLVGPGLGGSALLAFGFLRLSGWARTRRQQMDDVAGWLETPGAP